ncbi:DUF397 domain-containing protein [Streptomyces sp. MAR4 CNY-716]
MSTIHWVKSSYSNGDGGGCVEWASAVVAVDGVVPVRDSKDPDGPSLAFSVPGWRAFVEGVRGGEFGEGF